MSLYRYHAYGENGKKIQGVIDADSYEIAKERLRRQQVLLIDLLEVKAGEKEVFLDDKLLLSFTREMQLLLKAGLPVYESLVTIEEKYQGTKVHSLFLDLCDRLKHGHLLSAALKNYPKTFDEIYLCLIRAGEQTGELAFVFEQLYLLTSRKQKLKKQLTSSLVYPAFLGLFA